MQRDDILQREVPEGMLLRDAIPLPDTVWIVMGGAPSVMVKHGTSFTVRSTKLAAVTERATSLRGREGCAPLGGWV